MDDKALEQKLGVFDFSRCHPVRENLLNQLLAMHRQDNAGKNKWQGRMSDQELDWAVAAGNPAVQNKTDVQAKDPKKI